MPKLDENLSESGVLFVSTNHTEEQFLNSVKSIFFDHGTPRALSLFDHSPRSRLSVSTIIRLGQEIILWPFAALLRASPVLRRKYRVHLEKALSCRLSHLPTGRLVWILITLWESPILPILLLARQYKNRFLQEINQHQVRTVIFAEETLYNLGLYLIEECKRRNIRTIIIPFSNGVEEEYLAAARTAKGSDRRRRELSGLLFPEYSLDTAEGKLSFPIHTVLTANFFNISRRNVWSSHLDTADLYLYSDKRDFSRAKVISQKAEKIHLVEPPLATRILDRRISSRSIETTSQDRRDRTVLVLIPPNQFPIDCSFADYSALLEHYYSQVAEGLTDDAKCLASIHPRQLANPNALTLPPPDRFVVVDDLADGLVAADLVVSYGSAINSVVEYLQIPLVTYNIYNLENLDPSFPSSKTVIANRNNFSLLLRAGLSEASEQTTPSNTARHPTVSELLRVIDA